MLKLTIGRTAFKVVHTEDNRTTVWDVSSDDDQDKILATFKDVISFVQGDPDGVLASNQTWPPKAPLPVRPPQASQPPTLGEEQKALGWEMYDSEKLEDAP